MSKQKKNAVLRARCDANLKGDVQWAATVERLDEADIIRKGTAEYVQRLKFRTSHAPLAHAT